MKRTIGVLAALWAIAWTGQAAADWTHARCDIYSKGSDRAEKMIGCTFAQRQGFVTITREDGVTHELAPTGEAPGNYRDQHGRPVYRNSGLGGQGLIFRFPGESVYVYWDTAAPAPADPNGEV